MIEREEQEQGQPAEETTEAEPRPQPSAAAEARGGRAGAPRRRAGARAERPAEVAPEQPTTRAGADRGRRAGRAGRRRRGDPSRRGTRSRGRGAGAASPRGPSSELAADARYSATGKRKTAVARVIIRPGSGQFELNGRSLEVYFPRRVHQAVVRQPLEIVGFTRSGGRSSPDPRRGHLRPGRCGPARHRQGADRGRPRAAGRAQAPAAPDPRPAGEGASQGRPQEGAQAAPVLEALRRQLWRSRRRTKLFGTDGVRGVAGEFLTAELAFALGRAGAAVCDVPIAAGAGGARHAGLRRDARGGAVRRRGRGRRPGAAGRRAAHARRLDTGAALRVRPGRRDLGLAQPVPRQRHQVLRPPRAQAVR